MRRFGLAGLLSVLAALPALAHADITIPAPRIRAAIRVILSAVTVESSDAPDADRDAVRSELRRQLARQQSRIDRCTERMNLSEDPLRQRTRVLVGRMSFARSARPSEVTIVRSQGLPTAAQSCVLEAAQAVQVSTTPRGTVTLAFTYRVGY